MARLGEIFDLQMGKTPARATSNYWDNGNNAWVSIADLSTYDKYVGDTKESITDIAVAESGIRAVPADTVIMSFKLSLGKTAITTVPIYTNEAIIAFIPKRKHEICTDFFYHFCVGNDWSDGTNRAVMGATLNKATLSAVEISLPSIDCQKDIAQKLDKADALISVRKQQLTKLDELVKSRFIELFGDPVLNKREWMARPLSELSDIVSGITKGRKTNGAELVEVPYMAVSNVKAGYIDWTTVKTIEATNAEIERYQLQSLDVLMTEGGDPDKLGRGAIIYDPPDNCIHQNHIFRVRVDMSKLRAEYLEEYLQHSKAKKYFLGCAKQTTGIASINMKQLCALPILLPDISLQAQFATFVAQVDKSKFEIQKSLDKLEILKKALMQKYFE